MRIAGILLIIAGLLLSGWFGYVELFYLGKLESEFEEQKIKSEETRISRIKETEEKFNKMKAKLKNSKVSEKKIEQLDTQLEDLIMGLKANFNKLIQFSLFCDRIFLILFMILLELFFFILPS